MKLIKYIHTAIIGSCLALVISCSEDTPENTWVYQGPVPEITNGPSKAQQMCYNLWQKYDIHVYYNLSDDDALKTEVGMKQINGIKSRNAKALPMQAADEASAERFLRILTEFYGLLPDNMPGSDTHRRHVLVKINPGINSYKDDEGNRYYVYCDTEDFQGIIHYGYLDNDEDSDNRLYSDVNGWKWSICYTYFGGLMYKSYGGYTYPTAYGQVSDGLYYTEPEPAEDCLDYRRVYKSKLGKEYGFVHPFGANASAKYVDGDWATFVAWILTTPKSERDKDLAVYERLQRKYDIVIDFYKEKYKLDLESLSIKIQTITLN